jgi:vacuolar-type H+-ATPase subunit I/STV1
MSRLLKCSIALGASPLIIGTLIYFTWRLTRWHWLEMMGLMTILIGIIVFLAGAVCLILHLKSESRTGRTSPLNALVVGGLLFANFPLAAVYIASAIDISTRFTVRVYNESDHPIESFIILGPGIQTEIGPIPSGKKAIQHNYPTTDGSLRFTARHQQLNYDGELEGYVCNGWDGDKTVRVSGKGTYEITNTFR